MRRLTAHVQSLHWSRLGIWSRCTPELQLIHATHLHRRRGRTGREYRHSDRLADELADLLAPQAGSYYDVWLDGEKFYSAEREVWLGRLCYDRICVAVLWLAHSKVRRCGRDMAIRQCFLNACLVVGISPLTRLSITEAEHCRFTRDWREPIVSLADGIAAAAYDG